MMICGDLEDDDDTVIAEEGDLTSAKRHPRIRYIYTVQEHIHMKTLKSVYFFEGAFFGGR